MKKEHFDKLHLLRMLNTQKGYTMQEHADRFKALKDRHKDGTAPQAFTGFNLFQTPPDLVNSMIELAGDLTGKRILEPSAGLGRIYKGIIRAGGEDITLIEQEAGLCGELYRLTENDKSTRLIQADFLARDDLGPFDLILMNPPFQRGTDINHIIRASELLSPTGRLVAICANGPKQNKKLMPLCDSWEVLPEGTFKAEATNVSTVLLSMGVAGNV